MIQTKFGSISRDGAIYIIAEVGTTCDGDIEKSMQLIEAAKQAGADAIKFQIIDPEQLSDKTATYKVVEDGVEQEVNMFEMFQKLSFSPAEWKHLAKFSAEVGIDFFATVDFISGVDLLEEMLVPLHKIGAWDSTYLQLIERIVDTGKPLLVDLGPADERICSNILSIAGETPVIFLHDYHTQLDLEKNMKAISRLLEFSDYPVGYSSPNIDSKLDYVAIGLGATVIEKRLILSRNLRSFHAHESMEPPEFRAWVTDIRSVQNSMGKVKILPTSDDTQMSRDYFRSLFFACDVNAGDKMTIDMFSAKRPGTGIETGKLLKLVGKRVKCDYPANTMVTWDMFDG